MEAARRIKPLRGIILLVLDYRKPFLYPRAQVGSVGVLVCWRILSVFRFTQVAWSYVVLVRWTARPGVAMNLRYVVPGGFPQGLFFLLQCRIAANPVSATGCGQLFAAVAVTIEGLGTRHWYCIPDYKRYCVAILQATVIQTHNEWRYTATAPASD